VFEVCSLSVYRIIRYTEGIVIIGKLF
jgi:hypothetical protein